MLKSDLSDLAEHMFNDLYYVYSILSIRNILDEYVMGIIGSVTLRSRRLGYTLTTKNHRLKRGEANKIEAIVGLTDNLETLLDEITKSRWLKSKVESEEVEVYEGGFPEDEGKIVGDDGEIGHVREILGEEGEKILGKKILRAIKPLLWIMRFSDSRLHEV